MSSCVLEILTFTLLYRLKIAAAVGFSVSDDCSRASGLLSFLLRTFVGGNVKFSVFTSFRSTKEEEKNGLWMCERRRKDRKEKRLVLLLVI